MIRIEVRVSPLMKDRIKKYAKEKGLRQGAALLELIQKGLLEEVRRTNPDTE